MRALSRSRRHRALARRVAAVCVLAVLASLLVMPAVALAANLVTDYKMPSNWTVEGEDSGFLWIRGQYGASGNNDLQWGGFGEIVARSIRSDEPGSGTPSKTGYSSFEDFATRAPQQPSDVDENLTAKRVWKAAERTTLGGLEAYVIRGTLRQESNGDIAALYSYSVMYWIPTDVGGISVGAFATVSWDKGDYGGELGPITADVEKVLASLRFDGSSGTASSGGDTGGDTSPWRTVTGGIAAAAAAAIALAGAAASVRAKSGDEEPPPDQPVGYVLQLSSARLTVSETHPASLAVAAFRVLPNGSYQPASEAAIVLHMPTGAVAEPLAAYGTLTTSVWQTVPVALGAAITVQATAALGSTSASVPVVAAGESRIVTRFQPVGTPLRTQGEHSLTLVATVELLGGDAEVADPAAAQATIAFSEDSEWLDISAPADYEGGRAVTVVASQPDPTSIVQPPESAAIRVTAQVGERVITEVVTVELARLPEIDARPDQVTLAAESGISTEVSVWIANSADATWRFETEWREGSRLIAVPDIVSTGLATATLTITENAGDTLDSACPETSATLVVVATADGFEPLRRQIQVIVTQEGLFIDRTNVDPSTGAFGLKADGSATPSDIDLRVFVRDPATGGIAPDIGLAQQVVLEIGGEVGTPGRAGLEAGGLAISSAGIRVLNVPSATFRAAIERKLPTGGDALPATLLASVPGRAEPAFSALVPMRLLGVNTEPFSDSWQTELDNCRDTIYQFVPSEYQERLYTLVNERSLTMGTEGLYEMRKQMWSFAHDQLVKEAHEYMDSAWWIQQIEDTLDWVSWCGDIAMGVASGACLGVVGSVAIGMLKPLLVSAMETWQRGGSLEDWLAAQAGMFTGVAEGALTDPDFLTKLSGDKKAIGWALFVAYYFAKELYNDPQLSVTNAMKRVGAQLRDEGLIRFLQKIAGMKGGAVGGEAQAKRAKPDAGTPDASTAKPKPDAAKPAGPDASKPAGPDAAKSAADAPPEHPDGPDKATPEKPAADADKPAAKPKKPPKGTPAERAASMAADIAAKTADGGSVDRATVERVLRDPDAMRELKKFRPDLWKKMHETRAEIYESHDRQLEQWVAENLPEAEGRRIEVESFGTPDGVDRDYRVGYVTADPVTGQRRFIELKKETWAAESHRIFAKETGGPTDPKGAAKWAKDHQQLSTDQYHAEASVDMADQGMVLNERTGKWEKSQVTPNVDRVIAGESTLIDPDGLGKTYETKVAEAYHEGNILDAYKQADKAVHSLEGVGDGYAKQRYGVKDPPPKVKAGMDVIKAVQSGKITPEMAEARLKDLDYDGGLPDFMEKVSGQFASFKWVRKA